MFPGHLITNVDHDDLFFIVANILAQLINNLTLKLIKSY